jgi:transposase
MFAVELYAGIRRAVMVDGLSRREAAKRFGVHRNTISKMLQFSVPPGYRRRERPVSKKLGPYMAWIDKVLEEDRAVHKKQRHTAHGFSIGCGPRKDIPVATRSCASMWRRRRCARARCLCR